MKTRRSRLSLLPEARGSPVMWAIERVCPVCLFEPTWRANILCDDCRGES